jgi:serine/threonine-protein kinase
VPPIAAGATFDQAASAISAAELTPAKGEEFSDTVPAGQIIHIDPAPGTEVQRGSTVNVVVSKGMTPIPDVKNQSVADATAQLQAAGFTVAGVDGDPSRTVVATNPPAGTPAPKGTGVRLITKK